LTGTVCDHARRTDAGLAIMTDQPAPGQVDPKLLDLLVCPLTKGPLRYDRERQELISEQAGLAYPIRDGIPIMLVDEARPVDEDEAIPEPVRAAKRRPGRDGNEPR
jgi:uncharacterized protein YbaR (Trm112 family)